MEGNYVLLAIYGTAITLLICGWGIYLWRMKDELSIIEDIVKTTSKEHVDGTH